MAVVCPHCEREIDVPEIVELDDDQSRPELRHFPEFIDQTVSLYITQQDMIDADWRKVKC